MNSVAIVAVCSGDYSRYVEDWLRCLENIARPPDEAFIEFYNSRLSLGHALNRAVRRTSTDYVARLDIDDRAMKEYLDDIDGCTSDILVTGFIREDNEGYKVYSPTDINRTLDPEVDGGGITNQIPAASPFRRSAFEQVGGFPSIGFEDWGLWRLMLRAGASVSFARNPGYIYNRTPASRSVQEFGDNRRLYVEELMERCP